MTRHYKFTFEDGRFATEVRIIVPFAFYSYALWHMKQARAHSESTQKLVDALAGSKHFAPCGSTCDDAEAHAMASMWLARTHPNAFAAYQALEADAPAKEAIRARFQWNAKHWNASNSLPYHSRWNSEAIPTHFESLSAPNPWELAEIEKGRLLAYYPGKPTSEPQKAAQYDDESLAESEALCAECAVLESLLSAAQAEWKTSGMPFKRSNPFKTVRQSREIGAFSPIENAAILSGGSLWIAVRDNESGLSFLSPNGSSMREISRAKLFSTKDEALCWSSPDGALEISWSFSSFEAAPNASAASNQTLRAMQASTEREKISESCEENLCRVDMPKAKKSAKSL
jgi:hypothetical protein